MSGEAVSCDIEILPRKLTYIWELLITSKPEPTKPLPAVLVVRQFFVDGVAAKGQNLGQRTMS